MPNALTWTLDCMDHDFEGKSWNGPSLMATLDRLSAAEAASTATWEGYCAWAVLLHLAKTKYVVARELGAALPPWPHPEEAWFPAPPAVDEAAWAADRALIRTLHAAMMAALRALPESRLDAPMAEFRGRPWGRVLGWLATHDAYHCAQLRSMGLPSLKEARHE